VFLVVSLFSFIVYKQLFYYFFCIAILVAKWPFCFNKLTDWVSGWLIHWNIPAHDINFTLRSAQNRILDHLATNYLGLSFCGQSVNEWMNEWMNKDLMVKRNHRTRRVLKTTYTCPNTITYIFMHKTYSKINTQN